MARIQIRYGANYTWQQKALKRGKDTYGTAGMNCKDITTGIKKKYP